MFPGILLLNFSEPFLITLNAPKTTGIISVFICHILVISISRSLYLGIFSETLVKVFLSDGIATSMRMHELFIIIIIIIVIIVVVVVVFVTAIH